MSPIDWATRPLKKYATFSGRAPRAEYWWFYLLSIILYLVATVIDSLLGLSIIGPYGPVTLLVAVGLLIPYLAATVRRLHDRDHTGWWVLVPFLPYAVVIALVGQAGGDLTSSTSVGAVGILTLVAGIAGIALFIFLVLPGTKGPNRYGEDPYGHDVTERSLV
ncbi:DUF805 domain-containing protein [Sphingomonas sp. LY160]|uniref:DUF805 domain-containing protein n=1 Tax=Sphingomonas sp. LY160 TaxID=3095342 RepID=UPI002ADEDBBE|nr:DUF805 domain-containing protein [Sphingomonas sp. LY160]MEA1071423.1 DUF805 domain-containing protein [Sphingomonas sp. LY160]